jgi:hypothetical protein
MDDLHATATVTTTPYGCAVNEAILAHGSGNPGALRVLCEGYKAHGSEFIARVAMAELRGPAIWEYYKDICEGDLDIMYQMLDTD